MPPDPLPLPPPPKKQTHPVEIALRRPWIYHCPVDNVIGFLNAYPLNSDLSGGECYPAGPDKSLSNG